MKSQLILHDKQADGIGNTIEMKIWLVPVSKHTPHGYKYSLVYIVKSNRVIGYDNERGKGDHRHVGRDETPYAFMDVRQLVEDFRRDIASYKEKHCASQAGKDRDQERG